jgi:hypothetical protein
MNGPDAEARGELARRDGLLVGIVGFALLNGLHGSPFFDPAFILLRPFAPAFFVGSPVLVFYFTSLLLSTLTIMIGGVAAALFERATGRTETDSKSLGVWLAAVLILVMPSFFRTLGLR